MNVLAKVKGKLNRDGLMATVIAILRFPFGFRKRSVYRNMLKQSSTKQRFSEIYQKNIWSSAESGSGLGSEVGYTERLRSWLIAAIPKYNVRLLVDASCGDFNWMQHVLTEVEVEYFGFDIVDSIIDENKKNFSNEKIHFGVADICVDELPSCDFLIVRDCLFHLSLNDVDRFLNNISRIDYKYLLTTTHIVDSAFSNSDITTGDFRLIDVFDAPFSFDNGSVVERVDDYPVGFSIPREMVLIAKADVPNVR
jgi:SAM-dependent methyltransferase